MKVLGILCIFILTGVAWWLGYRFRPKNESTKKMTIPRDYLAGLNFLLNEETDKAVDIFIKMLEVDSETVETHLAVGKLFRKRGEVDRAIRIHQNLIARPQLEKIYREQSLFELGQDYLSAGMLDRAERVFLELIHAKSHSARALQMLIDIYQQEKDWLSAIRVASEFEVVTKQNMQTTIAHYYCELAEIAYLKADYDQARNYLNKAFIADESCVRASLLQAKVCIGEHDYKSAIPYLKQIKYQNPNYLSEAVDMLASCYEKNQQQEELLVYLNELIEEHPNVPIVLILAEKIRLWKNDTHAANFIANYVRRYPSLRGLHLFINHCIPNVQGRMKEDLHILQNLMQKIIANKPEYQCHSCGFSGKSLHWHCPGCKQWSTTTPMHGFDESLL